LQLAQTMTTTASSNFNTELLVKEGNIRLASNYKKYNHISSYAYSALSLRMNTDQTVFLVKKHIRLCQNSSTVIISCWTAQTQMPIWSWFFLCAKHGKHGNSIQRPSNPPPKAFSNTSLEANCRKFPTW